MSLLTLKQVNSKAFERCISGVIILNAIFLGAETYTDAPWLRVANGLCLAVFVAELFVRLVAYGRTFPRFGWNVYDAAAIVVAFVPGVGVIAQLARLARVVRLIRFLPDARVLLAGAARALPALGSLLALTALMIFLYGMMAVELFGAAMPQQFGNIGSASLTLFVMLSLENFPDTLYGAMEASQWAVPFFISYALLAAFVVFNLIIGIVISALEDARAETATKTAGPPEIASIRAALDGLEAALNSSADR